MPTTIGRPFAPGQSGNPSGRPKANVKLVDLARAHTADAIATLAEICKDKNAAPAPRVAAAVALLERGWGKPVQPTDVTSNGETVRYVILGVPETETGDEWTQLYAPPTIAHTEQ